MIRKKGSYIYTVGVIIDKEFDESNVVNAIKASLMKQKNISGVAVDGPIYLDEANTKFINTLAKAIDDNIDSKIKG